MREKVKNKIRHQKTLYSSDQKRISALVLSITPET